MKKSLIAAAVVAALPAFAQAQTNVTMYGIVDASVNVIDLGDNSRNALMIGNGTMSHSRWGVRGSEDLGGGLKAVFQLEAAVFNDTGRSDADNQTSPGFWARTAQVGLSGGFGTVKLGRGYTPAFRMHGTWDALSYGLFNNLLTATVPHGAGGADTAQTRFSNGIYYDSPSFGGFTINAAYQAGEATDEATTDRSSGEGYDISLGYKGGPLHIGGFYQVTKDGTLQANETERYGIGGGYDFGTFKLVAGYSESDPDLAGSDGYSAASIGAVMKLGTGSIHAQYIKLGNEDQSNADADAFALAYVHPLSKRTNLYAHFGITKNDDNGTFGMRTGAESFLQDSPTGGSDVKGFGVGIRHVF